MQDDTTFRKSHTLQKKIAGNATKYQAYREAWSRIKLAQENHFFLEAITIQESIISDRLMRFLALPGSKNPFAKKKKKKYLSFSDLIQAWKVNYPQGLPSGDYGDLIAAVDAWRRQRNDAIHSIVNPKPGEATQPIDLFLQQAKETAEAGTRLAREVCSWCQKVKKSRG
ncbi:MAG: hypothetical protein AAFR30_11835 [Cyanobacteria bacterium J06628_4]